MNESRTRRRGFTLIEILLVVAILAMVAGVLVVALGGTQEKTRVKTTRLLIETSVPNALDRYNLDMKSYPDEEQGGLDALLNKPTFEEEEKGDDWAGPYLKKEPVDAWGNELNYELNTEGEEGQPAYKLWSNGPDGESGTEDDIRNWSEEEGI